MSELQIAERRIGSGQPVYIIAELSANHQQRFERAVELIEAAKAAGADAVKCQTYTPDTLTLKSDQPWFRIAGGTLWDGCTLHELYRRAYMPWEWQADLKVRAERLGLTWFSTAYDRTAVEFLEGLDVPAYKVASFELTDTPFIEAVARTGKPVILSTGMATLAEIEEAVQAVRRIGTTQVALLKCTSAYPAPPSEMNLRAIPHLAQTFNVPVGLSDHTLGTSVAVAAVALRACIIEKHLALSRKLPGPDAAFSLEPHEFKEMVHAVRQVEQAMGQPEHTRGEEEAKSLIFRRSLFVVRDVKAGEAFTEQNVRSIRPAHGLPPRYLPDVLGRLAARDIVSGTPLSWDLMLEPTPVLRRVA